MLGHKPSTDDRIRLCHEFMAELALQSVLQHQCLSRKACASTSHRQGRVCIHAALHYYGAAARFNSSTLLTAQQSTTLNSHFESDFLSRQSATLTIASNITLTVTSSMANLALVDAKQ